MSGRVLVTGGAGFIGSHIAEGYLREGWDVTVLDDLSRGHEANVPQGAKFVRADIRSPEARQTLATYSGVSPVTRSPLAVSTSWNSRLNSYR